jgi:hypothetical protein
VTHLSAIFFRGSTPSPNAKALRGAITPDIRLWREHDRGGHFPMLEETETLAADITAFVFRQLSRTQASRSQLLKR